MSGGKAPETPHICRTCGWAAWLGRDGGYGGYCLWRGPLPVAHRFTPEPLVWKNDDRPCPTWKPIAKETPWRPGAKTIVVPAERRLEDRIAIRYVRHFDITNGEHVPLWLPR